MSCNYEFFVKGLHDLIELLKKIYLRTELMFENKCIKAVQKVNSLNLSNLEYIFLLSLPVLYLFLSKRRLSFFLNLIPFLPLLLLNLVSNSSWDGWVILGEFHSVITPSTVVNCASG